MDRKIPLVALNATSERIKQHFLGCMSERGAEMMLEDMEAIGPIKIKEVEAAQQTIIAIVRKARGGRSDKPAWNSRRAACCLKVLPARRQKEYSRDLANRAAGPAACITPAIFFEGGPAA